jgi:hypothetical protein
MSNHDPPRLYSLFSHSNKFPTLGQLPHSLTPFFSSSRLDSRALGQHIDTKAATSRCGSCTLSFHPLSVSPLCTYTSSIHPPSPAPPRSVLQAQLNGYRLLRMILGFFPTTAAQFSTIPVRNLFNVTLPIAQAPSSLRGQNTTIYAQVPSFSLGYLSKSITYKTHPKLERSPHCISSTFLYPLIPSDSSIKYTYIR